MIEKGNRIEVADRLRLVQQPGHPKTIRAHFLEDGRPFRSLESYSVSAMKARRNESDALGKMGLGRTEIHGFLQLNFPC